MDKKFNKPIVTGQQIGLLLGPLYTTYKILSAIYLADKENSDAVYWLETNDADFEEINKIHFVDKKNTLKTLTWNKNTNGLSTGEIVVDENLIEIFNTFFENLTETEHTDKLKQIVFSSYIQGEKLKTCTKNLAKQLFNNFKLTLFDPSTKDFREFTKPILFKEAFETKDGEQCNLFAVVNGVRKALFKKEGKFVFRDGQNANIEKLQLVPNLKTRNVCQDAYFKTKYYIAGPGEVKYIKTLKPYYEKHKVTPAKVINRMSLTLIEPKTKRLMKNTNLNLQDITTTKKQDIENLIVKKNTNLDFKFLKEQSNKLTKDYLNNLNSMGINTKNIKKELTNTLKKELGLLRAEIKSDLASKIQKAHLLSNLIMPYNKKQERVFNIFYYMNLYGGTEFINFLYNNLELTEKTLEINL